MTIATFHNSRAEKLLLIVEPWGEKHEIPPLATAGVRYILRKGAEDRCHSDVSVDRVHFWCNADNHEVDIVYPSALDKLAWEICVIGGWGRVVNGQYTDVDDFLPKEGIVTARDFAELTIRADGERMQDKDILWLESKFVEHLGASSIDAKDLRRSYAQPFEKSSV